MTEIKLIIDRAGLRTIATSSSIIYIGIAHEQDWNTVQEILKLEGAVWHSGDDMVSYPVGAPFVHIRVCDSRMMFGRTEIVLSDCFHFVDGPEACDESILRISPTELKSLVEQKESFLLKVSNKAD